MVLYNDLIMTEALDTVRQILASKNVDFVADNLERLATNEDLALAAMSIMVMKIHGANIDAMVGVEIANIPPSIMDLILPPGVSL